MTDKTPAMPDLTAVILWLENGCDPAEAVKELRHHQSNLKALAALKSAQPAAPSCVFGAVPLRPGDTLGPQTAACLTCGQPPACLSHPAESDRQQGLSITGEQPAAVSDGEIVKLAFEMCSACYSGMDHQFAGMSVVKFARAILALRPQAESDEAQLADYQEALVSVDALVHRLDVAINGNNAAPQARLCDIVSQVEREGLRPQAVPMTDEPPENLAGYAAAEQDAAVCQVPPFGWRCTREAGHEGPCAAVETDDAELVQRGMDRLREAHHGITQRADGGEG